MKELLLLGLAAIGGYFVYKKISDENGDQVIAGQAVAQTNSAQPSNSYPFTAASNSIARQDNQNQPWYGGATNFLGQNQSLFGINVGDLSSAASIIDSTKSIWDDLDLGNWFSSFGGDSFALDDYAWNDYASDAYDWTSLDNSVTSGYTNYDFSSVA